MLRFVAVPSWDGYFLLFSPKKQLPRNTYNIVIFKKCAPSRDIIGSWIFYERLKSTYNSALLFAFMQLLNNSENPQQYNCHMRPSNRVSTELVFRLQAEYEFFGTITEIPRNSVHFRIRNSLYIVQYFMALPSFPLEFKTIKIGLEKIALSGQKKSELLLDVSALPRLSLLLNLSTVHYRGH